MIQATKKRIIKLRQEGFSLRAIGKIVGYSCSHVLRILRNEVITVTSPWRCPQCGSLLSASIKYCIYCDVIDKAVINDDMLQTIIGLKLKPTHYKRYLEVLERRIQSDKNSGI